MRRGQQHRRLWSGAGVKRALREAAAEFRSGRVGRPRRIQQYVCRHCLPGFGEPERPAYGIGGSRVGSRRDDLRKADTVTPPTHDWALRKYRLGVERVGELDPGRLRIGTGDHDQVMGLQCCERVGVQQPRGLFEGERLPQGQQLERGTLGLIERTHPGGGQLAQRLAALWHAIQVPAAVAQRQRTVVDRTLHELLRE